MVTKIQKLTQSFQLIISHQARTYSSVMTIEGSSFTCFRLFGTLGQFGETRFQSPDFFSICVFKFSFHNVVNELF